MNDMDLLKLGYNFFLLSRVIPTTILLYTQTLSLFLTSFKTSTKFSKHYGLINRIVRLEL
jgi:hypothetical protein